MLKSRLLFKKIANFTGILLQDHKQLESGIFRILLKHRIGHLSVLFQFAKLLTIYPTLLFKRKAQIVSEAGEFICLQISYVFLVFVSLWQRECIYIEFSYHAFVHSKCFQNHFKIHFRLPRQVDQF